MVSVEFVNAGLKKFGQAWEETLKALEKGPEAVLPGNRLPSTVGEVCSHAECVGALSC